MKNDISKKLLDLDFKPNYRGFYYLVDAIYIKITEKVSSLDFVFNEVAKEHNTSTAAINRNILTCIRKSNNEYKGKTVGEVINTLSVILC